MIRAFLLTAFMLLLGAAGLQAQVIYEDFEGGTADLAWNGLNGTYNGAIANPDKSGANTSDWVGSYTNSPTFDFCFALYTFPQVLDISEFNQFRIKIWSPTFPAKALLKLEGPGGPAIEKFIDITEANKWVEYSVDFSAAAGQTNLKTILVSFNSFVLGDDKTYYFDDIVAEKAERCYETFESASDINWIALNGAYNGAIANPGPTFVNNSATVGSYTNNPAADLNFAFGTFQSGPIDLSVYNQFSLDVWLPSPAQVLFKLEGTGEAKEVIKYVPVGGAWQKVNFDMSDAAGFTTINKVLAVFNPFKTGDDKTYYFDNLCATPDLCKDVTPDPDILDDFECNRNAAYANGWDSLTVVKNPAPDGTNASARVGQYKDLAGPGTEFGNIRIDYPVAIDLTARNQFGLKLWSPKTGNLLLKIEGGVSAFEKSIPITETNEWVEYSLDLSAEAGEGHNKLVIFVNAGVNGEVGDVYFVDDIKLAAPAALPPLEDFEAGLSLGWQPLDQNEPLHGIFTGPTNNPAPGGVNDSPNVGCYSKGSSAFSTLQAFSLTAFDLSVYPQFDLDVLSPAAGGTVTMQLSSPTQGNKEAEATVENPGAWETLSFDFSAFSDITDFSEIRLIFNAGAAAAGQSWCIDNLRQSKTTVDPCEGVLPIPTTIDDYECQRNFVQVFYGASDLSVVNNPKLAPENGSLKVGEYKDPAGPGTEFAGIGYEFAAPPDLTVTNQLQVQVWAPAGASNVPFLFKLEGGNPQVEIRDTLPEGGKWHKFNLDFSQHVGTNNNKLVIFVNVQSTVGGGTYYIDNIRWSRAGYNGCMIDYETPNTTISNFKYFANGALEAQGYQFEVIDNPNPSGINTSTKVGKFVKAGDGAPFAGMYADLEAPLDWKGNKSVRAKVHMDHIGNFAVKLEGDAVNGAFIEIPVANTKVNAWEELSYNFSTVPDNSEFKRLTLFFDLGIDATGVDVTSYFDDIVIGDGACGIVNVFQPLPLEPMTVSPNPVSDLLRVENFTEVSRLEIFNALGVRVAEVNNGGDLWTEINVSRFPAGVYTVTGFSRSGKPVGMAKFIKQ
ncbi:MAG: T9SS type A sorting domain-containing protein [Saprospiraceae bacterium]|nr:T9SS type A sorting domain-containing protein [Saprospiraceae bacterium]